MCIVIRRKHLQQKMSTGKSVATQLLDVVRGVVTAANKENPIDGCEAALAWLQRDGTCDLVASAVVAQNTELTAFLTSKPSELQALDAFVDVVHTNEGSSEKLGALAKNLRTRWMASDIQCDDEGGSSEVCSEDDEFEFPATRAAVTKATGQLSMVAAVQQTLKIFPPEMAKKLDEQAASVGKSIRDSGAKQPGELLATVMQNPVFMEMMQDMMKNDPSEENMQDEVAHRKQESARLGVMEMRLDALERRNGNQGGRVTQSPASKTRKKKAQGGRTNSHTPQY
jgi:hypothetical protein